MSEKPTREAESAQKADKTTAPDDRPRKTDRPSPEKLPDDPARTPDVHGDPETPI